MFDPPTRIPAPSPGLAVFGSSSAEAGSAVFEAARAIGRLIAHEGLPVVTGGYGGVMEAASLGAREAHGEAIGVTCQMFRQRSPNRALTLEIEESDLSARTGRLIALARGFVVLEGEAGTLAELAMLWAYARAGAIPGPIAILDPTWTETTRALIESGRLDRRARDVTFFAHDPEDAVRLALGLPSLRKDRE